MRRFAPLVCLIFLLPLAMAMELTFTDTQNTPLKNLYVTIDDLDGDASSSYLFDTLTLTTPPQRITFFLDDPSTPGSDYYVSEVTISPSLESLDLVVFPAGSITGLVYDPLHNVVKDAKLKFGCESVGGTTHPAETDAFGSFSSRWVHMGNCRVFATKGSAVGYTDITVSQGGMHDVEIVLDAQYAAASISEQMTPSPWGAVILVFIGIAAIGIVIWKTRKIDSATMSTPVSPRAKDILKTLSDTERAIVDHLIAHEHMATQASIRNATMIPKTSLFRVLQSLERRKIVQVNTYGKLKKVELTPWFLSNE